MEEDSNSKNNEMMNGEDDHSNIDPLHVLEEEEDVESLKKRISGHPLYGFLIQSHLNCLKVGLVEVADQVDSTNAHNQVDDTAANELMIKYNISTSSSDLDHFMVGYCKTLKKLQEAMEEPVEETASFIKAMYSQLRDLSSTNISISNDSSCGAHAHAQPEAP